MPNPPDSRTAGEEKFAVRRSPLNGRGLFALAALPRRRKIGELSGSLVRLPAAWATVATARKIYMVQLDTHWALDCSGGNAFKYLNHSCAANCFLRVYRHRVEIYALRDIRPGTELTVDYGETPHRNGMRCRCGAANCRGVV
jgi:SET domain-containing protein